MKYDCCNVGGLIKSEELRHDEEIEIIAERIIKEADEARVVLIGGPSSSGKTTFAKRLTYHLNENNVKPLTVSTDDYFVGDARNPRDENGKLDYEHIQAVDLEKLNRDLVDLIAGKEVMMSRFDFERHAPAEVGHLERLSERGVVIIEGLHSLNPELTPSVPMNNKFLILAKTFTSPFRHVSNYKNGDGRLIRRMIRDSKYRGRSAENTIMLWDSVRAGERRWIDPFEHNAEYNFDTSLAYEPLVLKRYAKPLLEHISEDSPAFSKAKQLLMLLEKFPECGEGGVPGYSILREYIGGSSIEY